MVFNKNYITIVILLSGLVISSCSYSFTGSSVPQHLKTIFISNCKDKSNSGQALVETYATEKIKQDFIEDNTLALAANRQSADAVLDCTVVSYVNNASVVSERRDVKNNRELALTINVVYRDQVKKKIIFERSFTEKFTFIAEGNINEKTNDAIKDNIKRISENIVLAVVSNW